MTTTPRLRVEIHEADDGREQRPAVLLSNSIGTTARLWDGIAPLLVDAGYRVVRYDTRGHGGSGTPDGPCTLADLAADALTVLDELRIERAHVVGISLGGQTALQLALDHPGRVGRVVAANTGAKIGTAETWAARAATVRADGLDAIVDAVTAGWLTPAAAAADPALVTTMRTWFLGNDPAGYADVCGALGGADLRPHLARIAAPVLAIGATDDLPTPPSLTRQISDGVPDGRFVENPGAHLSVLEAPSAFAHAVLTHLGRP